MSTSVRIVQLVLRLSLAAAFLSAVADRFGWWGPYGRVGVAWGNMGRFAEYTHLLVPFASGWPLTVVAWGATVAELTLAVLLLLGWWPRAVGGVSCLVLTTFGVAMAVSLGLEAPLSHSVFTAAGAALAYAAYAAPGSERSAA